MRMWLRGALLLKAGKLMLFGWAGFDQQLVELRSPDTSKGLMRQMQLYVIEEQNLHGVTEELNSNMLC